MRKEGEFVKYVCGVVTVQQGAIARHLHLMEKGRFLLSAVAQNIKVGIFLTITVF